MAKPVTADEKVVWDRIRRYKTVGERLWADGNGWGGTNLSPQESWSKAPFLSTALCTEQALALSQHAETLHYKASRKGAFPVLHERYACRLPPSAARWPSPPTMQHAESCSCLLPKIKWNICSELGWGREDLWHWAEVRDRGRRSFDSRTSCASQVMNSVTHGVGFVLCILGTVFLGIKVSDRDWRHITACWVYSVTLCLLFVSSTLYHSFFALKVTRSVFHVLDLRFEGGSTPEAGSGRWHGRCHWTVA